MLNQVARNQSIVILGESRPVRFLFISLLLKTRITCVFSAFKGLGVLFIYGH